jgi:glycine cleavage system transcriptional repressor
MSRCHAVLTAIGKDKPGLVDVVSHHILTCGCNIEDSRMAILGGEFAMLILVAGDQTSVERLVQNTGETIRKAGLSVQAHFTVGPGESATSGTIPYRLEAYSLDHPGIVQRISHFLAERQINIRALDTRLSHAPHTGQPLFSLHATLDVPVKENLSELRRGLETIGGEENIDIDVKPANA